MRTILHLDISSFAATVAQVTQPHLRQRPTIVVPLGQGISPARVPVISASREAKKEGIFKGISLREALSLCRKVHVIPPDEALWEKSTQAILKVVSHYSPLIEGAHWGHVFADLTGTERLLGLPKNLAFRLQKEIHGRLRLPSSVGLASNKLVSHVAAHTLTQRENLMEILKIDPGNEASFLSPLSVQWLPIVRQGVDRRLLHDLNIGIVRELAAIPLPSLIQCFGSFKGFVLFENARGIDRTPVHPPVKKPEWLQEEVFAEPSNEDDFIIRRLFILTEKARETFGAKNVFPTMLTMRITYEDHHRREAQIRLVQGDFLFKRACMLFEKTRKRRIRIRRLRLCWQHPAQGQLQQVGLFSGLQQKTKPVQKPELEQALSRIRKRFGFSSVQWGQGIDL